MYSSFSSHSSAKLQELIIIPKVVEEFTEQSEVSVESKEEACSDRAQQHTLQVQEELKNNNDDDDSDSDFEFEFAFVCTEPNSSPISADEIFYNGQIRPTFPTFNTSNLNDSNPLQFSELFVEDHETPSSSSSEADELDGVQPETYCVWTPKAEPKGRCKKSNSTDSSKRWKFRDLLHRSNRDNFAFVTHSNANSKKKVDNVVEKATAKGAGGAVSDTEAHCVEKRGMKESERLRSFLPYREDLVGLFANMNG